MDCSLPSFSVHGILQARILEWVCHALFQAFFTTQRLNLCFLCLLHWQVGFYHYHPLGSPKHPHCFLLLFPFLSIPTQALDSFHLCNPGRWLFQMGKLRLGEGSHPRPLSPRQWVWWKSQSWARSCEDQSRGVLLPAEHALSWSAYISHQGSQTLWVENFTDPHFTEDERNPQGMKGSFLSRSKLLPVFCFQKVWEGSISKTGSSSEQAHLCNQISHWVPEDGGITTMRWLVWWFLLWIGHRFLESPKGLTSHFNMLMCGI